MKCVPVLSSKSFVCSSNIHVFDTFGVNFCIYIGRRKWQPTPLFLPGESQGRGSLVAAVYRVKQSRTRLKWPSSSRGPILFFYLYAVIPAPFLIHSAKQALVATKLPAKNLPQTKVRKWQPTPVFLPGKSQGRQSLVGCCLWGRTESDTTEVT